MQTIIKTAKSVAQYDANFLTKEEIALLSANCQTLTLADHPKFTLFGKPATMNRSIGFFSDESEGYRYSNQMAKSQPLPDFLQTLLIKVNQAHNTDFNGILVNLYKDGNDSIGAHSDDENGLSKNGGNKVIGISIGAERTVRFRGKTKVATESYMKSSSAKTTPTTDKKYLDHTLESGSLFTMEGDFQKEFTHEIPVQKKVTGTRISLTFRKHTS